MDKLKPAFTNFTTKLQQQQHKENGNGDGMLEREENGKQKRIAWPPKLVREIKVLGEVKDISGRKYPRDMGRSVQLGGHTYYMFGDTFCFDSSDSFCGVTNNSIALIPSLDNPTASAWLTPSAKVPEFVPLSDTEKEFGKQHEAKGENKRYVNWPFGGIIERPGSDGREGWLFYDTVLIHGAQPVKQCGIGVALARVTDLNTGHIECKRVGPFPLFDPDGPAWGNMSNLSASDGYTYLLTGRELDNYMARIRTDADFADARNYEFLEKGGQWVEGYCAPYGPFGGLAHDVLHGQGQGAIVYLPGFAPEGRPYMWFGNSKFPLSELFVGVSERPEGPWVVESVGEVPMVGERGMRYCVYPHVWGSALETGEVLVGWSDDGTMGGRVILGRFGFVME